MKKINIIMCETFKEEVNKISQNIENAEFQFFPCSCNTKKTKDEILEYISKFKKNESENLVIASNYCITPEDQKKIGKDITFYMNNYCKEMLASKFMLDALNDTKGFIITSGWLKHWKEYVVDAWGFDEKTAKLFFKETSKKIIYLQTLIEADINKELEKFSEFVGLHYQTIPIGCDYFRMSVSEKACSLKENEYKAGISEKKRIQKMLADLSMVNIIMGEIVMMKTEEAVIKGIMELIEKLFAPEEILYLNIDNGRSKIFSSEKGSLRKKEIYDELTSFKGDSGVSDNNKSIWFKIKYINNEIGVVKVINIAFPEYIKNYLNLIFNVQNIFGLAIENAKLITKIENLSLLDPLTDVNNRRGFFTYVNDNSSGCIVIFDVDKFKTINDKNGHIFGDKVLKETVTLCTEKLRENDIFARYGGDEFVIYLPETSLEEAIKIIERIDENLQNNPVKNGNKTIKIKLSFGISKIKKGETIEDTLKRADKNLYKAKNSEDKIYFCDLKKD